MDWGPYAVGGAKRPDSFTMLDPEFQENAYAFTQAAHEAGFPIQVTSAYRSPDLQAQLWEDALAKYGSAEAARKWVAPPGRSQHNRGLALDYALDGSLIRDADDPAAVWMRENAHLYGLDIPMEWEPWQVEPAGARGNALSDTMSVPQNALAPTSNRPQGNAFHWGRLPEIAPADDIYSFMME